MKPFRFLILFLALAIAPARALNLVTATINVTNQAGTTNGQTLTVNGDARTWTNSVFTPANQILTNNFIAGCTTNLFNQVSDNPFANLTLNQNGTNGIILLSLPGGNITATLSPGWGTVTYLTNVLTPAYVVRVPIGVEASGQDTNIASLLVLAIERSTNVFSGNDVAHSNYVSLIGGQTIFGAKLFTNQAGIWSGIISNGLGIYSETNFGKAFSSPGPSSQSEQFGAAALATNTEATAIGNSAVAGALGSTALGYASFAAGIESAALGAAASATLDNCVAIGFLAAATAPGATAVGENSRAGNTNSTAIGVNAITSANNQVMLGAPGINTVVQNYLAVGTGATFGNGVTNLQTTGTNFFPAGADISFGRYAQTSLANGNNADVPVGTNVFVEVSGPTGAFAINGINGQPNRDGKVIILLNRTGQNMTLSNDSGVDPVPANRIYCLTGADKVVTGNSAALLIYNANVTHWIVLNFSQ